MGNHSPISNPDPDTHTFFRCHWHACLKYEHKVNPTQSHPSYPYFTYEDVHQITLNRERTLRSLGLPHLESHWECEVNNNIQFQQWLVESKLLHVIICPIKSLREGLYGN